MDPNKQTRLSETKPDPFVGITVDGYRIEEVIGRGGMGTVYRAVQLSLGRPVAIKVLPADLAADPQFRERFHREADVLSKLSHPNIVTVFDRGEIEGRPYLAMEFIEGTSLRTLVREGPLAPAEALRIVSSVLAALEHAHDHGIVHRDIKPENVLLARANIVKVADFGLSRLLEGKDQTRLTRTHLVLGTYEYMAPEQRERAKEADERSDLFATGVVLYEMLTGELPIGRFEMPSQRRPSECDGRIDRLIERSLDKNPDQRYQHAEEMSDAVSKILDRPELQASAVPVAQAASSTPAAYRPVRFEYHIDNLATIDYVLGTICYVLGVLAIFGAGFTGWIRIGAPTWLLFMALGWYLRSTGNDLRKYKISARTSQAVIGILSGFSGILLPFTFYSFWALFGHRGRTYYEARGRGLDQEEAARYTYRLMEAPYQAASQPVRRRPARVPTPSQIPVQSMVTSDVRSEPRGPAVQGTPEPAPEPRRLSPFLYLGFILALILAAGAGAAYLGVGPGVGMVVVLPVIALTGLFLVIGFFHSLFSSRAKGAGIALLLLLFGAAGIAALLFTRIAESPRDVPVPETHSGHSHSGTTWPLAQLKYEPEPGAEERFFTEPRIKWLHKHCGFLRENLRRLQLARGSDRAMLVVRVPWGLEMEDRVKTELHYLLRMLLLSAEEFQLDPNVSVASSVVGRLPPPPEFMEKVAADPPPSR